MLEALAVIDITRIVSQVWATNHLTIRAVLPVIASSHNHMSISGLKDLIRHYILVSITKTFGGHARGHVIEILVGQQSHMRIQQSNINMLAFAAAGALMQSAENTHGGIHASNNIGDGHPCFLWATPRQIIALARDAHQPAHTLNHKIITR